MQRVVTQALAYELTNLSANLVTAAQLNELGLFAVRRKGAWSPVLGGPFS
jgi:hypothetical protein